MLPLDSITQDCTITTTFYVTLFEDNVMPELAEVTVIEMEGWKLYELNNYLKKYFIEMKKIL